MAKEHGFEITALINIQNLENGVSVYQPDRKVRKQGYSHAAGNNISVVTTAKLLWF